LFCFHKHQLKFSDTLFSLCCRFAARTRKSESCIFIVSNSSTTAGHTLFRFHRLRYKLAPVGVQEVTLGDLQQFVMPEQQLSSGVGVKNTASSVFDAINVSSSSGVVVSSTISFKAP
jgi:hypothetical protein